MATVKKISQRWLAKAKTEPERQQIRDLVVNSELLLDKLKEMLYNMQEELRDTVLVDYDTPSWSHKQAHLNGELDMLRKVIDLVTLRERDDRPSI